MCSLQTIWLYTLHSFEVFKLAVVCFVRFFSCFQWLLATLGQISQLTISLGCLLDFLWLSIWVRIIFGSVGIHNL